MEGVFVDSEHCMRIILPIGGDAWEVHCVSRHSGTNVENTSTWTGRIVKIAPSSKTWITFCYGDGSVNGTYNGCDCISFENGDKWYRLHMSSTQYKILTYKPYVPLTFIFLYSIHYAFTAIVQFVYRHSGLTKLLHKIKSN